MYWWWSEYLKCGVYMKADGSVCWCVGIVVGDGIVIGSIEKVDIGVGDEVGEYLNYKLGVNANIDDIVDWDVDSIVGDGGRC